ncbi:unnamed protein product [Caenorhabditis auriculariae]|uniref:Uncharacterized protein n=1 Tax=Caenorhabditis auriculariae TaxID=2777116 RepID=A0A8S1HIN8_9PELO|nr:unnamed protein product [Caenorhabditis auriculariae]
MPPVRGGMPVPIRGNPIAWDLAVTLPNYVERIRSAELIFSRLTGHIYVVAQWMPFVRNIAGRVRYNRNFMLVEAYEVNHGVELRPEDPVVYFGNEALPTRFLVVVLAQDDL